MSEWCRMSSTGARKYGAAELTLRSTHKSEDCAWKGRGNKREYGWLSRAETLLSRRALSSPNKKISGASTIVRSPCRHCEHYKTAFKGLLLTVVQSANSATASSRPPNSSPLSPLLEWVAAVIKTFSLSKPREHERVHLAGRRFSHIQSTVDNILKCIIRGYNSIFGLFFNSDFLLMQFFMQISDSDPPSMWRIGNYKRCCSQITVSNSSRDLNAPSTLSRAYNLDKNQWRLNYIERIVISSARAVQCKLLSWGGFNEISLNTVIDIKHHFLNHSSRMSDTRCLISAGGDFQIVIVIAFLKEKSRNLQCMLEHFHRQRRNFGVNQTINL